VPCVLEVRETPVQATAIKVPQTSGTIGNRNSSATFFAWNLAGGLYQKFYEFEFTIIYEQPGFISWGIFFGRLLLVTKEKCNTG
jgi:hypothetical protein